MTDNTVTINALPDNAPRTLHKANLTQEDYMDTETREVADLAEANVVSSIAASGSVPHHYPVLDLDVPARLVPSSTPGHSHLYIDKSVPDEVYWRLCEALVNAGILEPGYVSASMERGYTSVRLPWIKKEVSTNA